MKKLIGIIAAVAMAASVFALNDATSVSAKVEVSGSLFNYDKTGDADGKTKLLKVDNGGDKLALSIDLGKVGGSMKAGDASEGQIWFKPFDLGDLLKITMGHGACSNYGLCGVENFKTTDDIFTVKDETKCFGDGFGFRIESKPLDALTLDASFITGKGTYWYEVNKQATNVSVTYNDTDTVGTVKLFWSAQEKFEKQRFGLGWTKTFGDITPKVNFIAHAEEYTKYEHNKAPEKVAGIARFEIEPSVKGAMDPLTWTVYVPVVFDFEKMSMNTTAKKYDSNADLSDNQPDIGVAATVDYKFADSGMLKNAWLKAGAVEVEDFDEFVALGFEVGAKGDLSDNTHWSLTVDPVIVSASKEANKVVAPEDANTKLGSLVNVKIYPKLDGSYGGMSWELGVKITTGRDLTSAEKTTVVDVPFKCSINF